MLLKLVFALALLSCNEENTDKPTIKKQEIEVLKIPYQDCLNNIEKKRLDFQTNYKQGNRIQKEEILDTVSEYLEKTITDQIMPYWYGTTWDFNGHTNEPNEGEIACGYLVSTTLKHFGFKLNRYKFAQQSATSEAKTLQSTPLKTYRNKTNSEVVALILKELKEGLYMVGLDNHVGYLLVENNDVYFIHSSYCSNQVEKEKAIDAPCFTSNIYVIGEISTNRPLLKKWVMGTTIPIHLD